MTREEIEKFYHMDKTEIRKMLMNDEELSGVSEAYKKGYRAGEDAGRKDAIDALVTTVQNNAKRIENRGVAISPEEFIEYFYGML